MTSDARVVQLAAAAGVRAERDRVDVWLDTLAELARRRIERRAARDAEARARLALLRGEPNSSTPRDRERLGRSSAKMAPCSRASPVPPGPTAS